MSLRRGKYARLEAAGGTVMANSPCQGLLVARVHRRWSR